SHTVDETLRRIIRHEALRELSRNEVGCGRMARHDIEHLLAVFDAAAGGNRDAEHDLLAGIVEPIIEHETAAELWPVDAPAGEAARRLGHVLLRVAAVYSERVQLQQLAAVILIQTAAVIGAAGRLGVG